MEIRDPFRWLPAAHRRRAFTILALLAVALMAILNVLGVPLRTEVSPAGIIGYEFAGSAEASRAILQAWGEQARVYAGLNLGLDYLFLLAYGSAIALGCVIVARSLRASSSSFGGLGLWLAWAVLAAALLDGIENYALIRLLLGADGASLPAVARVCASAKFLLVALSLLYVMLGTLALGAMRLRNAPTRS